MISDVCIEYNKKKKQKEHVALDIDEHDNYCEDEDDKDYDKKYLSKFDILKLNNGWNEKNETYIVRIGENAASFRHMHDKTSNQYTKYDAVL